MNGQTRWQSVIESIGGTGFRTILQIAFVFFISGPLVEQS